MQVKGTEWKFGLIKENKERKEETNLIAVQCLQLKRTKSVRWYGGKLEPILQ